MERTVERAAFDLNEIAIFAAVVDAANLTKAAHALGLPKSTVSRKIAALEHRLGVRLLHRTPRRIDVTEAGRTLHEEAREALALLTNAADRVGGSRDGMRGKVRVSAPVDLSIAVVGPLLCDFSRAHADITVEVEFSDRKVDLVAEGFDFAVRVGEVLDPALVQRPVGNIRGHLVASKEYVAKHGVLTGLGDIPRHRFIQFAPTSRYFDVMRLHGPRGEVLDVPFTGQFKVNSLLVTRDAILSGLGIARLPTYLSAPDIATGKLVHLLPGYWTEERPVRLVHTGRKLLPSHVALLLDQLAVGIEKALSAAP